MAAKIFWSWQGDRPAACCREFVRGALESAAELVAKDLQFSERPEIDHDVKGEAGLAEIARTVFRKIDESRLFIGDVTPIGKIRRKQILNPNVSIELGYAAHALGWDHLVLVANRAWGWDFDHLPFDLKHRSGTIDFDLSEGADEETRRAAFASLVDRLKGAITDGLRLPNANQATGTLELAPEEIARRAAWAGQRIIRAPSTAGGTNEYTMPAEPRLYAIIRPARSDRPSRGKAIELMRNAGLWGMWASSNGDSARLDGSAITFGIRQRRGSEYVVADGCEWFSDRGELRPFIQLFNGRLSRETAPKYWAGWLIKAAKFFESGSAVAPFRVELCVSDTKKVLMFSGWSNQEITAIDQEIRVTGEVIDFSDQQILPLLIRAEENVADCYNLEPNPTLVATALASARHGRS